MQWIEDLFKDVRLAGRSLLRQPGFTLVSLLTLTLGIGANTVVFGVVNAALLRPLPYPDANRLVRVREENQMNRGREMPDYVTSPTLEAWNEAQRTIEAIAGYNPLSFTWWNDEGPERLRGAQVTSALFPLLRAEPALGRVFTEMDGRPVLRAEPPPGGGGRGKDGRPKTAETFPVAILSHRAWQSWFDGSRDVLGQLVKLDGGGYINAFEIVGVMPEGFGFPEDHTDVWVPLTLEQGDTVDSGAQTFSAIARLRDGIALAQAQAEGQTVMGRLTSPFNQGSVLRVTSFHDEMVGETRPALLALMAAVALVMLIVTANLANLLLARGTARRRELAVRAAIGAGRARLIRQLLTESVVLGLAGGALGLATAYWVLEALPTFAPTGIPGLNAAGIDLTVLGFTVALSLGAGLLFGVMPALKASRFDLVGALNESAPAMGGGFRFRPGNRTRSVLTYAQWPFEERLANVDIVVRTAGDPLDFVPFLTQDVGTCIGTR